jgi:LCP family protein required for cell wall assembly
MTEDRTDQLIRDAFADQAARATDGRDVLEALRSGPKRRYGVALATAAVAVVVVAVAAFVVPEVFRRSAPPPPAAEQNAAVAPTSVLVVGVDEEDRTDTIVLTRTYENGAVTLTSIPRDVWNGQDKLNRIYATKGMLSLVDAVEDLTGVRAEHWAVVDMSALAAVADSVGGVPVCLRDAVDDRYSGAHFPAGQQKLEGAAALAFVRQRHGLPNGDLDRVARQQAFLSGLSSKLPRVDLRALYDAVHKRVQTDTDLDLLGFVETLARSTSLHVGTIPVRQVDLGTPQGAAIEVDPAEVKRYVADQQGTPPSPGVPCVN